MEKYKVDASKKLAEADLTRMEKYKSIITKVGKAKKMDPAVIAGIISRETRAGAALKNGQGHGSGFGLMQVGWNRSGLFQSDKITFNIAYCTLTKADIPCKIF